jgi:hypothetical protein
MRHTRLDASRLPRDARHAHAALPGAAFAILQRAGAAALIAHDEPGAVVTGEKDERVLCDAGFAQRVHDLADAPVELLHRIAKMPGAAFALERGEANSGTCGNVCAK